MVDKDKTCRFQLIAISNTETSRKVMLINNSNSPIDKVVERDRLVSTSQVAGMIVRYFTRIIIRLGEVGILLES